MGIKISDLTSATSLTGSEELPIVQSGNTKKATVDLINKPIDVSGTFSITPATRHNTWQLHIYKSWWIFSY